MSSRTTKKITRSAGATTHFADDTRGKQQPRNRTAGVERPMRKLRELLCRSGERSDGGACVDCASPCRFGEEYLERQKEGEAP
jgi:hypothetical protein